MLADQLAATIAPYTSKRALLPLGLILVPPTSRFTSNTNRYGLARTHFSRTCSYTDSVWLTPMYDGRTTVVSRGFYPGDHGIISSANNINRDNPWQRYDPSHPQGYRYFWQDLQYNASVIRHRNDNSQIRFYIMCTTLVVADVRVITLGKASSAHKLDPASLRLICKYAISECPIRVADLITAFTPGADALQIHLYNSCVRWLESIGLLPQGILET